MQIKTFEAREGGWVPLRLRARALMRVLALPAAFGAISPAWAQAPCAGPERLCASTHANTSAHPAVAAAAPSTAGAKTDAAPAVVRVALLLPLRSATLAAAAESVRAGFMAAAERDGAAGRVAFKVEVVSNDDNAGDVLDAYARAAAASDIVVGPLARAAVGALAASNAVVKPTVVLSVPDTRAALPRAMLVAGLSVEDEARQVADWAARDHPHGRVLILTGGAAWAQRAAGAFAARWTELGHTVQRAALPDADDPGLNTALAELEQRLQIDPPDALFAALDTTELDAVRRQVPAAAGATIPVYGGGAANPGRTGTPGVSALDGIRILDLPWIVAADQPAVAAYPRPLDTERPLDMDRLYALGIDAFQIVRAWTLHPGAPFVIDGVTGRLHVAIDAATGQVRLQRRENAAVVRSGGFEAVDGGP